MMLSCWSVVHQAIHYMRFKNIIRGRKGVELWEHCDKRYKGAAFVNFPRFCFTKVENSSWVLKEKQEID